MLASFKSLLHPTFASITAIPLIFTLSILWVNNATAQSLSVCPNTQVGSSPEGVSVYSDCTMENQIGDPGFHLTLSADSGNAQVISNGYLSDSLSPTPVGNVSFGRWDGTTLYVENMGPSYTGDCLEMTSTVNFIPLVDSAVFCGRVGNTDGNFVLLRGTWDESGNTFTDPVVYTTQPGVGIPVTSVPVPTLSQWALILLIMLLGLMVFANRKRLL